MQAGGSGQRLSPGAPGRDAGPADLRDCRSCDHVRFALPPELPAGRNGARSGRESDGGTTVAAAGDAGAGLPLAISARVRGGLHRRRVPVRHRHAKTGAWTKNRDRIGPRAPNSGHALPHPPVLKSSGIAPTSIRMARLKSNAGRCAAHRPNLGGRHAPRKPLRSTAPMPPGLEAPLRVAGRRTAIAFLSGHRVTA